MASPISKLLPEHRVRRFVSVGLLIMLMAASAVLTYQRLRTTTQRINYSQLYQIAETGSAASVFIESDTLTVRSKQGEARNGARQLALTRDPDLCEDRFQLGTDGAN